MKTQRAEKRLVMPSRSLGSDGLTVSAIGVGCMGMTWAYGKADRAESIATIRRALDLGVTLFDTADIYGPFLNEELVGQALAGHRQEVILATKCGLQVPNPSVFHHDASKFSLTRNGSPQHILKSCDESLRRLRTDYIDLYQLHRVDPKVPVQESVSAMATLVEAGKVRHIGLSECTVDELSRANQVHPVSSVQSELSLWTRDVLSEILPFCQQHGIGFLAYSPLGRGFFTGRFDQAASFAKEDFRSILPRFQPEALKTNVQIVDAVKELAIKKGATAAQVALAWVLAQGENVVGIPGVSKQKHLEENLGGALIQLTKEELACLDQVPIAVGGRWF
jgi:aryl-alcohol dehydrogenase-like predicted oxidoreductase